MHIKFQIKTDLVSHTVHRDIFVSEFYTLHELHLIIEASLGWENSNFYSFSSEDLSWVHCNLIEDDPIPQGTYLTEGTKVSEILPLWSQGAILYNCGRSQQWEFALSIVDSVECHPDIMTAMLSDGQGHMPPRDTSLANAFIKEIEECPGDDTPVLKRKKQISVHTETALRDCSDQVSSTSIEISKARKSGMFL